MYLIPRNISKRFEFFPGWGWKELLILLAALGIGAILSFALGLIISSPLRFLLIVLLGGIGYVSAQPVMADGSTALQILSYIRRYQQSQKLYLYRKGGI
jgi:hypothetical protein